MKKNLSLMPQFYTPEVATFKHFKNIFPLEIITIKELCMDLQTLKYAYFLPISNDYNLAHRLYVMLFAHPIPVVYPTINNIYWELLEIGNHRGLCLVGTFIMLSQIIADLQFFHK